MAACFPGAHLEKNLSWKFGGDGEDRGKEFKGVSETEVYG